MRYIVGRQRKRHPQIFAATICAGLSMRRSRPGVTAWRYDEDLGSVAAFPTIMMTTKRNKFATWSVETDLARPLHVVFLQGDKSEAESNDECGETPARCVVVVLTVWQSARGPDLVLSICQVVCGVCSSTAALGPVRRWFFWCVAVCFSWLPVVVESRVEVPTTTRVWDCWEVPRVWLGVAASLVC